MDSMKFKFKLSKDKQLTECHYSSRYVLALFFGDIYLLSKCSYASVSLLLLHILLQKKKKSFSFNFTYILSVRLGEKKYIYCSESSCGPTFSLCKADEETLSSL